MVNRIQLEDVIFVDDEYSLKHPHMIHRHKNFLELLYIAEASGRYIVGNYEYAVTVGDFVICNANVPQRRRSFSRALHTNLLPGAFVRAVGKFAGGSHGHGESATDFVSRRKKFRRELVAGNL